jgi:hypothetical protein
LIISFFPHAGSPVEIIIPQIIINTNDIIKIIVTSILAILHINTGNAVSHVTAVSSGL